MTQSEFRLGRLFADLALAGPDERFDTLVDRPGVRIMRIVSTGQASSPGYWYDQPGDEWVAVLQGEAGIEIEGEAAAHVLGPGDFVFLPAHCRHRVAWTSASGPTVWLAVHIEPAGN